MYSIYSLYKKMYKTIDVSIHIVGLSVIVFTIYNVEYKKGIKLILYYLILFGISRFIQKYVINHMLEFKDILDKRSTYSIYKHKMPSLKNKDKHPLYQTVKKFYENRGVKRGDFVPISVSLGVDSSVLLDIVNDIGYIPISYHKNLNNRSESIREAMFIKFYCENKNILYEINEETEYRRNSTPRDEYETKMRNKRYSDYKQLIEKYNCIAMSVGHHSDDVTENVFTNALKGRCSKDLCVMHPSNIVMGVQIWRPILHHPKSDVYDYAHKFGVPYFKDTTPDWSNRGIMRRVLFPQLDKQYGKTFRSNLYRLGLELDEQWEIMKDILFKPFIDNCTYSGKYGIYINYKDHSKYGRYFWNTVMLELLHDCGKNMLSRKTMNNFMSCVNDKKDQMITLNKNMHCYFKNHTMFIMFNKLPLINKHEIKMYTGVPININNINIMPTRLEGDCEPKELNYQNIIDGNISYTIYGSDTDKYMVNKIGESEFPIKLIKQFPIIKSNERSSDMILINFSL